MATSMNTNDQPKKSSVGLLLVIGEIYSNEQREDLCVSLQRAFQHIDYDKFRDITDLFNNLLHENEFQADCQYRQIASTENGSLAGFLYLPNFHTVVNVLRDLFNLCHEVSIIFCGQQIASNGALVLSDSLFTCENLGNIFEENPSYLIRNLQIVLPLITNQWNRLAKNFLPKYIENIQLNDLSNEQVAEEFFGDVFYDTLAEVLYRHSVNFDIPTKLVPRDNAGTIAFDEPNLYVLYGQQGEASLFGVRGFVVLVNGGFNRYPSYWNLIRGLQNIDACILTHFDYDVLPGLQTIVRRKTIPTNEHGELCKPDIGAVFLNHIQRMKFQSVLRTKSSSSTTNNSLLVNFNENIEEFLNDIKQLNIDTFDLVKQIKPINLYRKLAFGSLDFYILHPTTSTTDDERIVNNLQKIPINNHQPSTTVIPLHHWYSSCSLLVWTPTSKSTRDYFVRILYTGACPQTLVFEALNKVRSLDFLREPQPTHLGDIKIASSFPHSTPIQTTTEKPKVSPPLVSKPIRTPAPTIPKKTVPSSTTPKPRPVQSTASKSEKPKISQKIPSKPEKPKPPTVPKKAPVATTSRPIRSIIKEKPAVKPQRSAPKITTKPKEPKKPIQTVKAPIVKKPKETPKPKIETEHEQKLETLVESLEEPPIEIEHEQKLDTSFEYKQEPLTEIKHEQKAETPIEYEEQPIVEIEHEQKLESPIKYEEEEQQDPTDVHDEISTANEIKQEENQVDDSLTLENHNDSNEYLLESEQRITTDIDESLEQEPPTHEIEQDNSFPNDTEERMEEKTEPDMSADELDEHIEISADDYKSNDDNKPEPNSLNTHENEHVVESNVSSPMSEIKSPSSSHSSKSKNSFEHVLDTVNPFTEKTNNETNHNESEEMEIVQHDVSTPDKHQVVLDEEIHPQGLPIQINHHSNKSSRTSRSPTAKATSKSSTMSASSSSIFYVDVAYIPYHGNEHYVDSEFFRRIRARYYILNAVQINRLTLESLINGRQQWDDKDDIPITLIPTYDGEQLRQFFLANKTRLAELNITILPAATRCNVQYDDEGSPAQCIRFNSSFNIDQ